MALRRRTSAETSAAFAALYAARELREACTPKDGDRLASLARLAVARQRDLDQAMDAFMAEFRRVMKRIKDQRPARSQHGAPSAKGE